MPQDTWEEEKVLEKLPEDTWEEEKVLEKLPQETWEKKKVVEKLPEDTSEENKVLDEQRGRHSESDITILTDRTHNQAERTFKETLGEHHNETPKTEETRSDIHRESNDIE